MMLGMTADDHLLTFLGDPTCRHPDGMLLYLLHDTIQRWDSKQQIQAIPAMQWPSDSLHHYTIATLLPHAITMRSRHTGTLYRYHQRPLPATEPLPACTEGSQVQGLLLPIRVETGLLYELGGGSLAECLGRGGYGEEEVLNTLHPVLGVLAALHQRGLTHGAVTPANVVIDGHGVIRLYYPGILEHKHSSEGTHDGDRLGDYGDLAGIVLCMLGYGGGRGCIQEQLAFLRDLHKQGKYTQGLIFGVYCLLMREEQYLQDGLAMLLSINNPHTHKQATKLQEKAARVLQQELLLPRQPQQQHRLKKLQQKVEFTPPFTKHQEHLTPRKTLQVTKKYSRIEDAQNKHEAEESRRKRPADGLLRRPSNGKAELETSNRGGASDKQPSYRRLLRDIREAKEREDVLRAGKRLRTIEKKKIH